jgi:glycosyltransferase involved in cell wall biosynthesis
MESVMSGAAVVAIKVAPYEKSIEHGVTGFLAKEESDWVKYISLLVENKELREKIVKAAQKEILEKYNIEKDNTAEEFYKSL